MKFLERSAKRADGPGASPARIAAFRALLRVERDNAFAATLLSADRLADMSTEDRRLAHEITLGVLRWRGELDYLINVTTGRAAEKLDLPVRIALWIGLYQIRHLDRIPEHAAVNESVELLKHGAHRRAAPLVNAALRMALRERPDAPDDHVRDRLNRLSISASHPRWLVDRWIERLGIDDATSLACANNAHPPVALRINPLRAPSRARTLEEISALGIEVRDSAFAPGALVITAGHLSQSSRPVREGWVYVQDEASQLVGHLVAPQPGDNVLDVCAAPGSKATLMAALMGNTGRIVAVDKYRARLATVVEAATRLAVRIIEPLAADSTVELPLLHDVLFDRVLVDAPCSGTGTLRRNPEIKWRLAPADIPRFTDLQKSLLDHAAERVRPGGRIVYSTCSLEPEENEVVASYFLERHREFSVVGAGLPGRLLTPDGFVRTYPHRDGSDGFFAAVLERTTT